MNVATLRGGRGVHVIDPGALVRGRGIAGRLPEPEIVPPSFLEVLARAEKADLPHPVMGGPSW